MSKELTQDQRDKAAARKASFRALAKRVADMTPDARAELAGRMMPQSVAGTSLSVHNACLIAFQNPNATIVGGFRQWLNAGRAVRKGEHGLMIWVPCFRKPEGAEAAAGGEPTDKFFVMGTVFDVSQTDAVEVEAVA